MALNDFPNVVYATSTAADGNMSFKYGEHDEVLENRKKFLDMLGVDLKDCVIMAVEHQDKIVIVGPADKGRGATAREDVISAEALIANEKGLCLMLLTADCFPISFYDPHQEVIALAHLGWRPTGLELVKKVIAFLEQHFGTTPEELMVSIGPGIHKESYTFDDVEQKDDPHWQPFLDYRADGKIGIDILGYNLKQLEESDISTDNIEVSAIDTGISSEYFSYYRAAQENKNKAIFATILGMRA